MDGALVRLNALNGAGKLAGKDQGGSEAPIGEIGVQLERALELGNRQVVLRLECQHVSQLGMALRQVSIEMDGVLSELVGSIQSNRAQEIAVE